MLYEGTGCIPNRGRVLNVGLPRVIAHRGASLAAPENTLPAFELAIAAGAGMIETDAQLTADDEVVLAHDADLSRTTGVPGLIGSLRLDQIRARDAGFSFRPIGCEDFPFRGRGLGIPTLQELLDLLASHPAVLLNLEIKAQGAELAQARTRALVTRSIAILSGNGMLDRTLLSSFEPAALSIAQAVEPRIAMALVVSRRADFDAALARAVEAGCVAIHPDDALLGSGNAARGAVAAAHRRGLRVNVWTVDREERMRDMIAAGVDGIITNDPARLRRVIAGE